MQTFLPYPNIQRSIECLDNQRLGKQRVEARMIHDILTETKNYPTFKNHPAVKMWIGYAPGLSWYHDATIIEWIRRGFNNSMPLFNTQNKLDPFDWYLNKLRCPVPLPKWFGAPAFHTSHRSNLLRKAPTHYGKFNWADPPTLPYVWPIAGTRIEDALQS